MEESPKDLGDYIDLIRRRKYAIVLPWIAIIALTGAIAFLLPSIYQSRTTILIENQIVPPELVRSTVTGLIDERINILTQQIMSRPRLLEIINRLNLYTDLRDKYTTEEIIDKMRDDIDLETISADVEEGASQRPSAVTTAFTVSYQGKDPTKVQNVANILASLYLEENLKNREQRAKTTTTFLEGELAGLAETISDLEKQIALFKEKHLGELPELMQLNLQTEQEMRRQIDTIDQQIKTLVDRRVYLEGQLSTVEPDTPLIDYTGRRVLDSREKLRLLRTEYISLASHLSDKHPDLIRIKKEIEELERAVDQKDNRLQKEKELKDRKSQLETLKANYSQAHPDVIRLKREIELLTQEVETLARDGSAGPASAANPENPAYINLMTQIQSTTLEIESLKKQKEELTRKWNEYVRRLENTPQVEREYLSLNRDYGNGQAKYKETMDKLIEARRAEELEEKQGGEKFTIIDPAQYPEKPHKPNRLAIILIGFILGMGGGIGFASVLEYMDHSVRSADSLAQITGIPVLTVIPKIFTEEERIRARRKQITILCSCIFISLLILLMIHLWVTDLSILWLRIGRRLNLPGLF